MPKQRSELPSTLQRSDEHAQEIFIEAHASALETYHGDEARAHRVAYAALKQKYQKAGERWVQRDPSRSELYEEAKRLDIPGRSKMNRAELETAIQQHT